MKPTTLKGGKQPLKEAMRWRNLMLLCLDGMPAKADLPFVTASAVILQDVPAACYYHNPHLMMLPGPSCLASCIHHRVSAFYHHLAWSFLVVKCFIFHFTLAAIEPPESRLAADLDGWLAAQGICILNEFIIGRLWTAALSGRD